MNRFLHPFVTTEETLFLLGGKARERLYKLAPRSLPLLTYLILQLLSVINILLDRVVHQVLPSKHFLPIFIDGMTWLMKIHIAEPNCRSSCSSIVVAVLTLIRDLFLRK